MSAKTRTPSFIIESINPHIPMSLFSCSAFFVGGDILELLSSTGAVAKFVLVTLLAFSLISWAIILTKWSLLRRARVQSGRFLRAFRKAQRLQDIATVADQFRPSPLVGVFEGGYQEYKRQQTNSSANLRSLAAVQRGMQIGASEEITRLERSLACDYRVGHTFYRPFWYGVGHYRCFSWTGYRRGRHVAGRRARHLGGTHHNRCRTRRCHPGCNRLQPDWQFNSSVCGERGRLHTGSTECH